MAIIRTLIGLALLAGIFGATWGIVRALEVACKSIGDNMLYVLASVPVLLVAYLFGEGFHQYRESTQKAKVSQKGVN
jgi:hypothetical protein